MPKSNLVAASLAEAGSADKNAASRPTPSRRAGDSRDEFCRAAGGSSTRSPSNIEVARYNGSKVGDSAALTVIVPRYICQRLTILSRSDRSGRLFSNSPKSFTVALIAATHFRSKSRASSIAESDVRGSSGSTSSTVCDGGRIIFHAKLLVWCRRRILKQAGPLRGNELSEIKFFIEQRARGDYAIREPHSLRASAVALTQKKAVALAREMNPDAAIHVERVRDMGNGSPGKWRKI